MNCAECKELLVAYVEGLLDESQKEIVAEHLNSCTACQAELKELTDLRDRLVNNGKALAKSNLENKVLERIIREQNVRLKTATKISTSLKIRRIIMKSKITKLAAVAMIIIAVIVGVNQFGDSIESTAFAEVMENIQNAQTLTYQSVITPADQEPQVAKTMVLEPHLMRVELADGRIWILDHSQGKTVVLDSKNKEAVISSTSQRTLGLYDTFRQFRNIPDFSVSRIGQRRIEGTQAEGFQLIKENDKNAIIIVWANPQTSLPIRIERTTKDNAGKVIKIVTTNIIFDGELDKSLFRLDAPKGYSRRFVDGPVERSVKLEKRSQTLSNMTQILLACIMYSQEHEGQWPDSLQDVTKYGLTKDTLINPRQPEREIGYVYVKPSTPILPQQVVLYEVYDSWGDGINVGFVDGHAEFIEKESNFNKKLKKQVESR